MMHAREKDGSSLKLSKAGKAKCIIELELRVVLAQGIVLVNVRLALPGVGEPDVGGVNGREVLDVLGNLADLGLEPEVVSSMRSECTHLLWTTKMASLVSARSLSRSASSSTLESCSSMSFFSSLTVYMRVVRESSTSSTMSMRRPSRPPWLSLLPSYDWSVLYKIASEISLCLPWRNRSTEHGSPQHRQPPQPDSVSISLGRSREGTYSTHALVEVQTNGLDGDVALRTILNVLAEGTQDTGRDETSSADGNEEVRSLKLSAWLLHDRR